MNKKQVLPELTDYQHELIRLLYPKYTMLLHDTDSKKTYFFDEDLFNSKYKTIPLNTFIAFIELNLIFQAWGMGPFTGWRLLKEIKEIIKEELEKGK